MNMSLGASREYHSLSLLEAEDKGFPGKVILS